MTIFFCNAKSRKYRYLYPNVESKSKNSPESLDTPKKIYLRIQLSYFPPLLTANRNTWCTKYPSPFCLFLIYVNPNVFACVYMWIYPHIYAHLWLKRQRQVQAPCFRFCGKRWWSSSLEFARWHQGTTVVKSVVNCALAETAERWAVRPRTGRHREADCGAQHPPPGHWGLWRPTDAGHCSVAGMCAAPPLDPCFELPLASRHFLLFCLQTQFAALRDKYRNLLVSEH